MKKYYVAIWVLALSLMTGPAFAGVSDFTDPRAIKAEIERLRVFYTDNHPDIQRLRRHLAKIEALKAQKEKQQESPGKAKPAPMEPNDGQPPPQTYKPE